MALTPTTLLGQITSTGHGTGAFATSSFTPPSSSLLVVGIMMQQEASTSDQSLAITCAGGGWTYTRQANASAATSYSINVVIFTAPVSTGVSMTLSIDCGAVTAYVYGVSVVAYAGYDTGTPVNGFGSVVDVASPDGAQSLTTSAAPTTDDVSFGLIGMDKESIGVTPGATFSEIHDLQADAASGLESESRTGSTSTTVDWIDTHTGTGGIFGSAAIGIVVKNGGPPPAAPMLRGVTRSGVTLR